MANEVNGIFDYSVFGASRNGRADKQKATQGFGQIFASLIAKEMREALQGKDQGPMGIAGGTTGDIYGAFFDEAMGNALARSPAFKPFNRMIDRELGGPRHADDSIPGGKSTHLTNQGGKLPEPLKVALGDEAFGGMPAAHMPPVSGLVPEMDLPNDEHGPLLLPPTSYLTAPVLPPPSRSSKSD